MKQRIICKTLAVAVILLFIGVGVQPAVAVTPDTSNSEDDCDICLSVEDLIDNKDVDKYQELLDKINSLKGGDEELNYDGPICDLLGGIFERADNRILWLEELMYTFENHTILGVIFSCIFYLNLVLCLYACIIGIRLGCWEGPFIL